MLAAHGEAIGVATNNVAEYSALVAGLAKAAELQIPELEVVSDSELMVKQMQGDLPREERGAARALARGGATRARGRQGHVHGRAAGAEQARRPARQ